MTLNPVVSPQSDYIDNALTPAWHQNLIGRNLFVDPCIEDGSVLLQKAASGADLQYIEQMLLDADSNILTQAQKAVDALSQQVTNIAGKRTQSYTVAGYVESYDALATATLTTYQGGQEPYYANRVLVNDPNPANYALNGIYDKTTGELVYSLGSDFPAGTDIFVDQLDKSWRVLTEATVDGNGTITAIYFDPWAPFISQEGSGAIHTEDSDTIVLRTTSRLTQTDRQLSFSTETENELAGMHSEIDATQADITNHSSRLTQAEQTLNSHTSTLTAQASGITNLQNADNQIRNDFQAADTTLNQQIGGLSTSVGQLSGRIGSLEGADGVLQAKDADLQNQINVTANVLETKDTPAQRDSAITSFQSTNFQEIKLTDSEVYISRIHTELTNQTKWRIDMGSSGFDVVGYYTFDGNPSARREKRQLAGQAIEGSLLEVTETGNIANNTRAIRVAKFIPVNL